MSQTAQDILKQVVAQHGITVEAIRGKRRSPDLVKARADFVQRVAAQRVLTDGQIGRFINRGPHTVRYHRLPDYRARKIAAARARKRQSESRFLEAAE